jgi:hypothetical protein
LTNRPTGAKVLPSGHLQGDTEVSVMTSTDKTSTYEPPVLTVLGSVHDLTEGFPAGPLPDALNINHNSVSNPRPAP